ncbi:hypothetical protein ABET04_01765, partial [Heyndrickxia coagulans]
TPEIFDFLSLQKTGSGGEIQLTDAIEQLNEIQKVYAYAKANRNSSPTYSLVRFAPSHPLRMGDFFRKAVKNRTDDYHAILFETRLLGQKAVCISGEEAVKMFYDPEKFKRNGAVPKRIQKTLFGENAIQTLDGKEHLHRKALFLSLMGPDAQQHLA